AVPVGRVLRKDRVDQHADTIAPDPRRPWAVAAAEQIEDSCERAPSRRSHRSPPSPWSAQHVGSHMPAFVALPDLIAVHIQTCEPPAAAGVGVDADGMANTRGAALLLRCVAADDDLVTDVRGVGWELLPAQDRWRLFCDRSIGCHAAVDEDVMIGFPDI